MFNMNFIDFLKSNTGMILFFLIFILFALALFKIFDYFKSNLEFERKTKNIINGMSTIEGSTEITSKEIRKKAKKRKQNFMVKSYKEYIFFNGKKSVFFRNLFVGYAICFVLFFILSNSALLAFIFALSWFVIFYISLDGKNGKKRKKYVKGFALALKTLTATVEAGNSFEEGISLIMRRETINPKIRAEFALINNNLKSGKSLEESLEAFWARNSMFQEFSMFVIVMQFYSKKGGAGLGKILLQLETTLSKKVENYAEIDTELGIHKGLMNCCIYAYFLVLLFIKMFKPTFYIDLANSPYGAIKALGSVILIVVATVFFKGMVRSAAEG